VKLSFTDDEAAAGKTKERPDPAFQTPLIELERRLAVSLESQTRVDLHGEGYEGDAAS
jgi:hypothetical protein